jgi:hypothetical protein
MKNKRLLKISLAVFVASLIGVIGAYFFLMLWMKADLGDVYPDSATSTSMYVIKRRILHYAKENNKLPHSVDELPVLEGFFNHNTDYWGGKIIIQVEGTTVSLISYGKDMKPGGTGENLDLIAIFEAKTSSGSWADENDEGYPSWKKQPGPRLNNSDYK